MGFVNLRTGIIIPPKYQSARVYPGFLRVHDRDPDTRKNFYILLDDTGKEIGRYDAFQEFSTTDLFAVRKDGKWALLGRRGKPITSFQYNSITSAAGTFMWGNTDRGRVLVDSSGREYRI
jgi:hypothetical protein